MEYLSTNAVGIIDLVLWKCQKKIKIDIFTLLKKNSKKRVVFIRIMWREGS